MQTKILFSELFQSNMLGASVNSGLTSTKGTGGAAGGEEFSSFLRKYQENDFNFLKVGSSQYSGDLNDVLKTKESKEKLINLIVKRMKAVLRDAADNSSFVSFSQEELQSFRQVLASMEDFSGIEVVGLVKGMENSSGKYLPDMINDLENINLKKTDIKNVYFPFSFIPYFETALQGINLEHENIRQAVESSVDIEKGFSLQSFLSSLEGIKGKLEESLPKLEGNALEEADSKIKGLDVILSVFSPKKENPDELVSFDKKAFENFITTMEEKLNSNISKKSIYKDILFSSASKKESEFVNSLLNNQIGKDILNESFLPWKNKKRSEFESSALLKNKEGDTLRSYTSLQEKINSILSEKTEKELNSKSGLINPVESDESLEDVKKAALTGKDNSGKQSEAFTADSELSGENFESRDEAFIKKYLNSRSGLEKKDTTKAAMSNESNVYEKFSSDTGISNTSDATVLAVTEKVKAQSEFSADIDKLRENHFKNSHEYSLFTKLSSVELDYKNYFSGGDNTSDSVNADNVKAFTDSKETIKEFLKVSLKESSSKDSSMVSDESSKKKHIDSKKDSFPELSQKTGDSKSSTESGIASNDKKASVRKSIMNQVEKQIIRTVKMQAKEMSFRLNPPDLGKMHLKLENVRNGLNIKIIAEKSTTHEILLMQAQDFKHQLQSQGMQVAEVNVELAQNFDQAMARERRNGSGNENKGSGSSGNKKSGKSIDALGGAETIKPGSAASDSGLDLIV